jgi:hypothetical protein
MIDLDAIDLFLRDYWLTASDRHEVALSDIAQSLVAELRQLRAIADSRGWSRLVTDNAALRERLAAAEADTARLDWIDARASRFVTVDNEWKKRHFLDLRTAIDAAIARTGGRDE